MDTCGSQGVAAVLVAVVASVVVRCLTLGARNSGLDNLACVAFRQGMRNDCHGRALPEHAMRMGAPGVL